MDQPASTATVRWEGGEPEEIEAEFLSPEYQAYLREIEEADERATARRGQPRPHSWGDPLPNEVSTIDGVTASRSGYFCGPCWDGGDPTGFHPFDQPPCDPPARFESRWA